jgi:hypothetical protein
MKSTRLTSILNSSIIACALALGTLASTEVASAQTPLAEVTIPFAFQTPDQVLPAGTYRIDRESTHLILLRGPAKAAGFVQMHDAIKTNAPNHGYLVFDRYGDKYFLRQIWQAGSTDGYECSKSRAEKETLQANNKKTSESFELAFNAQPQH